MLLIGQMVKQLTGRETRRAIQNLGIDRVPMAGLGLFDGARNVRYAFHRHQRHQLIFPEAGVLFVEAGPSYFACTPEAGLWIPAGLKHATTTGRGKTISVFFGATKHPKMGDTPVMVRIAPLLRESAIYAATGKRGMARSKELFLLMRRLVEESVIDPVWPSLPVARSEAMQKTVSAAMQELGEMTVPTLARLGGVSERTLRRRFIEELGMGPEQYLQRAKLMRAMQWLIGDKECSITEIALQVGYSNHSAFSAAFRRFTGLTPKAFRGLGRDEDSSGGGRAASGRGLPARS